MTRKEIAEEGVSMPLDFEKGGIKFHAENGWAKAEKDGKELWRSLDVFKDNPPTEELVLGLHKIITDSWYLREN